MKYNNYLYILVMFAVTYVIRTLPLTLIRGKIRNVYVRSFLHYVPYVTLTVMTFPAILDVADNRLCGGAALIIGILLAWKGASLMKVAIACCVSVFLMQLAIGIV